MVPPATAPPSGIIHLRGQPDSEEYMNSLDLLTEGPDPMYQLDYIDIDALTDHTKFDPDPDICQSSYADSIDEIATHVQQYDLESPIMVPVDFDQALTTVSDKKYNLLTNYHRCFDRNHIAHWSSSYKQHLMESSNSYADNLLQDYFMNCITGILPTIEQSAASLVYLALTKLHSNSSACIPALQGSIFSFKLWRIIDEDVSLASSWLNAIIKTLRATNNIPSHTISHILSGMATSQSTTFNSYVTLLATHHDISCTRSDISTRSTISSISSVLDNCCDKYRELLQAGQWPMAQSKE
jgi:hypothetical protein